MFLIFTSCILVQIIICVITIRTIGLRLFLVLAFVVSSSLDVNAQSVDLVTGGLQFAIPLGELRSNDISVPVTLAHHGNAIAVAEGDGDCGLGWNIMAGGSVTRVVRGLPDDFNLSNRKGWLFNNNASSVQSFQINIDNNLTDCSDEYNEFNFLLAKKDEQDTEPDLFYFSAPGISGKFVLNGSGVPKLLEMKDVSISNFSATSFTIKSTRGLTYTFSDVEAVTRRSEGCYGTSVDYQYYCDNVEPFTARWHLTSIQSSVTGTQALFSYVQLPMTMARHYKEDSLNHLQDWFNPKQLSTVSMKNHLVEFFYGNNLITKVKFSYVPTGDSKTYTFDYQSVSAAPVSQNSIVKTFLKGLRTMAGVTPLTSFEFEYAGVDLTKATTAKPWRTNWKQDWFGYYNGVADNKNKPTVYFYSGEEGGKRFRVTPIPGVTATQVISGDNRAVVSDSVMFGALVRIAYPTGGATKITYEPNNYLDASTNEILTGGGIRVKKITTNGSDIALGKDINTYSTLRDVSKEYEYKVDDGINAASSGKLIAPLKFGYANANARVKSIKNLGDAPEILYSRVKEKVEGVGSTVYEFSIPGTYPQTTDGDWKATKSYIARRDMGGTCVSLGDAKTGFYSHPFPTATNYDYARGFLTKTLHYSKSGTPVRKREITPKLLNPSPADSIMGLRFEYLGNMYSFGVYKILTGRALVPEKEIVTEYSGENSSEFLRTTTVYSYTNNMVSQITDTLTDKGVRIQKFRYAKDYAYTNPTTDTAAVALKGLRDNFRHTELVEQITKLTPFGGTESTIDARLIVYRNFGDTKILPYYIKTIPSGVSVVESSVGGSQTFTSDTDYYTVRTLKEYDADGRVLNEFDHLKNKAAHHYSSDLGYEVATFTNAKSSQGVSCGFETTSTLGLTITGSATFPAGWTGEKSLQMTTGNTLTSTALVSKGESKYRISCWVNAAQSTILSFKAKSGSTVQQTVTLSNGTNNQWVYLEGEMDMAPVSTTFSLEVTANNTITVDDILFIPKSSRAALQTVKPLTGITSSTDDRGNSVKQTYDVSGRPVNTLDRNRNLVKKTEYLSQKQLAPQVTAGFTASSLYYKINQAITFTALPTWGTVTYSWLVDNETPQGSTASTMIKTFTMPGTHVVKLTVTDTATGSSANFSEDICIDLAAPITMTATTANSQPFSWIASSNTGQVTFSLQNLPQSSGCTIAVTWRKVVFGWSNNQAVVMATTPIGSGTSIGYTFDSGGTIIADVSIVCGTAANMKCLGEGIGNYTIVGGDSGYDGGGDGFGGVIWCTVNCP